MKQSLGVGLIVALLTTGWPGSGSEGSQSNTTAATPAGHVIEIRQMAFIPASISVGKGDRVTFVNRDIVMHDVTEKKKTWQSHPLGTGKSWTVTVTQSADYYCSIHPVMRGRIIVK